MRKYGYLNTLSTASGLHIDIAPFNQHKIPHIRLDFNPNNFNPNNTLYYTLLSCAKNLRISRIDYNMDFDTNLADYKWQTDTARSQVQFLTSKDGLETLYLGSKTSSDFYRIYDKEKERAKAEKRPINTANTLWRIEHVFRLGTNDNYTDLQPFNTLYGWKPDTFTGDYFDDLVIDDLHRNPKNFGRLSRRKQTLYRQMMKDNTRTVHLPQAPEEHYLANCQPLNSFLWDITTGHRR
jgi:hypothetical protein